MFDLGIVGGTIVGPSGQQRLHVYVSGERIAALTPEIQPAQTSFDASGLLVMPGMVDTHVHLMDPAETQREDFPRGTAAAARAGVTTIVEHTHTGPVRTARDLQEKRSYLADRSVVDFGLAAHAWPDMLGEVDELWRRGVTFFKAFTCTTHRVPAFDTSHLVELFSRTASLGAVCLVHCEDEEMTKDSERALRAAQRDDGGVIPEWRSLTAEVKALSMVTSLAARTHARIVTAHASCAESVATVGEARTAGADVKVESCPQYFTLLESEVVEYGALRKFTPPARARAQDDHAAMWRALADGRIDHISSDHAPSTRTQKASGTIWTAPFGLPGLDTTLSVLLDGASQGWITYERVTEAYAEAPARTYGLFPRKGQVAIGADADFVLVDSSATWNVADEDILSRASWSPYSGRKLAGRAVRTYVRGHLVAADGKVVVPPGRGHFVAGPGATH